jgi:DNA-binding response OmpR family regulator
VAAEEQVPEKHTVRTTGGETILVVEDDPSILALLQRILSRKGYEVLAADSPIKARELAALRQGEIHLLLTDVVLPDTNGRELAGQLSADQPDLMVLFMSGYTSNVIVHRGVLDDDVCFIQKPFDSRELLEKVRGLLDGTL